MGQQFGRTVDVLLVLVVVVVGDGVGAVVLLVLGFDRNRRRLGRKLVWLMFVTVIGTSTTCLRVGVTLWQAITF